MLGRWWRTAHGRALPKAVPAEPAPTEPYPDALCELLDDMRDLRLTLAMDLTAAASATEAGANDLAADIIEADQRDVAAFVQAARRRLAALGDEPVPVPAMPSLAAAPAHHWRRRALVSLPAIPLVGAVALSAAAAAGLISVPGHSGNGASPVGIHTSAPVTSTFHQFEAVLNGEPSASQVLSVAKELHTQIAAMLAASPQDPSQVGEVAQLLQLEQALLLKKQPPGSSVVLAESRQLAAQLAKLTPAVSPSSQPTSSPSYWQASPPPHHHTQPSAPATPTPTSTSTKAPAATAQPTPTASSSPSSSPDSYPTKLPNLGN